MSATRSPMCSVSRIAQASASDGVSITFGSRWLRLARLSAVSGRSGMQARRRASRRAPASGQEDSGDRDELNAVWKLITMRPGIALDHAPAARAIGVTQEQERQRDRERASPGCRRRRGGRPAASRSARRAARSRRRHWRRAPARARAAPAARCAAASAITSSTIERLECISQVTARPRRRSRATDRRRARSSSERNSGECCERRGRARRGA